MRAKKITVLDEMGLKGGGVYCILPYERLDKNGKAVFKVGLASNLRSRMEQHHTDYPLGFYYTAILENPLLSAKLKDTSEEKKATTSLLRKVEKYIFNEIENLGGQKIHSTTRVRNLNVKGEGATEWFYTNEDTIHQAFTNASIKFGGKLDISHLNDINKTATQNEKRKKKYLAEIIYKL